MLKESPWVTVIIPTHNRADMLCRALNSVLNQSFTDFEVIVVDDGSTDNTQQTVEAYADPRIRYFKHDESKGASAARNTGIRHAYGKYIAFLDDDDEWAVNKLAVQVPVIAKSPAEVGLVYAWMEYYRDGKSIGVRAPQLRGNIFVEMLDKQAISGSPTVIIKREVIDKVGFFDEALTRGNDGDYWRRISRQYEVEYVPEILAKIHIGHNDRISCDAREGLMNEIIAYEKRLETFKEDFKKHPEKEASIRMKLGIDYVVIGAIGKGLFNFLQLARCRCSFALKAWYVLTVCKQMFRRFVHKVRV
ncbi:MAG: glycosyltransferase family 2 protein, partial [bacterium]